MVVAASLLAWVVGCSGGVPSTEVPTGPNGVFVGEVEGGDALLALIVDGDQVTAYMCGGEETWQEATAWLDGTVDAGAMTMDDGYGAQVTASFDGTRTWEGTVTLEGRDYAFRAGATGGQGTAGFYLLDTDSQEIGLIVAADGSTAGVYYGRTSTKTAPVRVASPIRSSGAPPSTLTVTHDAYSTTRTVTVTRTTRTFPRPTVSPRRILTSMVARAGMMSRFQLVAFDDDKAVADLRALALATDADPDLGKVPSYVTLPRLTDAGTVETVSFTAYHHDVRGEGFRFALADAKGNLTTVTAPGIDVTAPSMTFQGFPAYSPSEFANLLALVASDRKLGRDALGPEATAMPVSLALVGDEVVGTYFGDATSTPRAIEGLHALLGKRYPAATIDSLIASTGLTYVVYDVASTARLHRLAIDDVHGVEPTAPVSVTGASTHDHDHDHLHEAQAVDGPVAPAGVVTGSDLLVTIIFDPTIYDLTRDDPWVIPDAYERAEAGVNRANTVWGYFSQHIDEGADDFSDESFQLRVVIDLVTAPTAEVVQASFDVDDEGDYDADLCGDADGNDATFMGHVREVFEGQFQGTNRFKMVYTNAYTGGCAWEAILNTSVYDPSYVIGTIGIRDAPQDYVDYSFVHEAGHIIGGMHNVDEYGDTGESVTSHRCKMLGAFEIGPEGPSVMSYAAETDWPPTLCFAYPTDTRSPKKNLTYVGEYLLDNLY